MAQYATITGTTQTTIGTGPVRVWGVYANATSSGTTTLRDGSTVVATVDATALANADLHGVVVSDLSSEGSAAGTIVTVLYDSYP